MKLTTVLPVYNVEPYLAACLDSLLKQTYPPYEIIAINDGSTDGCLTILTHYQTLLPQLKIITQPNQGLSVARNVGIAYATGDYIHCLDSDDYLAPNAYEQLNKVIEFSAVDIVLFNGFYYYEGRKIDQLIYQYHNKFIIEKIITGQEYLIERFESERLMHMVWLHCYKTEFIKSQSFEFTPNRIHEDVVWTTQVLLKAQQAYYLNEPLIYYRIAERRFTPEVLGQRMLNLMQSSISNVKDLLVLVQSVSNERLKTLIKTQAIDGGFSVFHQLKKITNVQHKQQAKQLISTANYFSLLWCNASTLVQKRKIILRWLKFKILN